MCDHTPRIYVSVCCELLLSDCVLTGLEHVLEETSGRFSVGDEVTIADVALVPQFMNATR